MEIKENHFTNDGITEIKPNKNDQINTSSQFDYIFEVFSKLYDSIREGAFVSSLFYVRKEVWFQSNAKVMNIEPKLTAYKKVVDIIDSLHIVYNNGVANANNYRMMVKRLREMHATLKDDLEENDNGDEGLYKTLFKNVSSTIKKSLMNRQKLGDFKSFVPTTEKMLKLLKSLSLYLTRRNDGRSA